MLEGGRKKLSHERKRFMRYEYEYEYEYEYPSARTLCNEIKLTS